MKIKGIKFVGWTKPKKDKKAEQMVHTEQPVKVEPKPEQEAEETKERARQLMYKTKDNQIKQSVNGQPAEIVGKQARHPKPARVVSVPKPMRITPKFEKLK